MRGNKNKYKSSHLDAPDGNQVKEEKDIVSIGTQNLGATNRERGT